MSAIAHNVTNFGSSYRLPFEPLQAHVIGIEHLQYEKRRVSCPNLTIPPFHPASRLTIMAVIRLGQKLRCATYPPGEIFLREG